MPPYRKGAAFGDLERLEHAVSHDQAVVSTGNSGLLRIVVKVAVQPDSELSGQTLRNRCGELHADRLSGCHDHADPSTSRSRCRLAIRLDSGHSLGYGF